ncbi:MAG TPA: P63C domain-containing protein [Coleofasciculaceae cyanobacterium]
MASNIVRFDGENGIEVLINTATGESFASISGYARMAGISRAAVSKRMKTCNQNDIQKAEIETARGLKPATLIPANLVFRWLIKDNPELAEEMGIVGATVFLHKLAGYSVTSNAVTPESKVYTFDMAIRRDPMTWERMFTASWIAEAERLTGWRWTWKAMSGFIVSAVYAYLPYDVVMALRELNPKDDRGNRIYKHHQFLQPEIRDIVASHLNVVEDLMKAARGDMKLFELIMANRFGRYKLIDTDDPQMNLFKVRFDYILEAGE